MQHVVKKKPHYFRFSQAIYIPTGCIFLFSYVAIKHTLVEITDVGFVTLLIEPMISMLNIFSINYTRTISLRSLCY